ncbi:hypothetical protein C8R44DRAFT_740272 [Mycena epipterygia]|nr:hypothetical protein C8R44DRAFT_740272 [Mycena epipterygia]
MNRRHFRLLGDRKVDSTSELSRIPGAAIADSAGGAEIIGEGLEQDATGHQMPRGPTVTDIQLSNIVACVTPAAELLNELHDGFGTPFVQAISNTTLSLVSMFQECQAGLQKALEVFKVERGVTILADVMSIQKRTETMHQELLELISNLSDETTSDRSSSCRAFSQGDFGALPPIPLEKSPPKIFHHRELEPQAIVDKISQEPARNAILGTGGMGKTSLARAALHRLDVGTKYEQIFFVACDSATTSIKLAALVGSHVGLKPEKNLTKAVIQYFSQVPSGL